MYPVPPGALIDGRFEVTGKPLAGGMGVVYLCLDHQTHDYPVALKTFKPEYLPNLTSRERFLREGSTWVSLGAHPHIVRCYLVLRVGDGTEVYLVLELVSKEQGRRDASLRSWLAPGQPLPPDQALLYALQVARGMRHATQVVPGLVHRDLKPENLLVGADSLTNVGPHTNVNRLRITDFGLARVVEESANPAPSAADTATANGAANPQPLQMTRGFVGTPRYMAPEVWLGKPVSAATDVYALGCILIELLTGKPAVSGAVLGDLLTGHVGGAALAAAHGLPPGQRELAQQLVATQPAARMSEWSQVEVALAQAYAQLCGQAVPEPEPEQGNGHGNTRADRVAAGYSYGNIGISYLDIGKAQVAKGFFERALQVGRAEHEQELEGFALGLSGSAALDLGDARSAVELYEQSLNLRRLTGDRRGEGQVLGNLGVAHARLGDVPQAIAYHQQALAIHREVGDRLSEGATLGNLGSAYADTGDQKQAIECYEQALAVDRAIGDRSSEAANLANLGGAHLSLNDAQQAIDLYNQALAIHHAIGEHRNEGADLVNLGLAYADQGDVQRDIACQQRALAIAREVGDRHSEGIALGNLGSAYSKMDDVKQALSFDEQSLAIAREIGDASGVATRSFNMALLYKRQNDAANALASMQQAADQYTRMGNNEKAKTAQDFVDALKQLMNPQQSAPAKDEPSDQDVQRAMVEFQLAGNLDQMRRVVVRHPYLATARYVDLIGHFAETQTINSRKVAYTRRLAWLRQIAEGH